MRHTPSVHARDGTTWSALQVKSSQSPNVYREKLHALPLRTGVSGAQSQQTRPHCNPAQARHTAHLLNVTGLKLHDEQDLTAQRDGLTALGIVTDGAYDDHGLTGTPAPGPVYARPSSARSTRPLANTRPSGVHLRAAADTCPTREPHPVARPKPQSHRRQPHSGCRRSWVSTARPRSNTRA